MSKFFRTKFPGPYKIYQEIVGDIYYEVFCLGGLLRRLSGKRLKALEKTGIHPLEVVNGFKGLGLYRSIKPVQMKTEIMKLYEMVKERAPEAICEIGTDKGGTLYMWSKAVRPDGTLISIDLPRTYRRPLNRFFRSFFKKAQEPHFLLVNSHTQRCKDKVRELLEGKGIDFLFIDGDHSYEGVKSDFHLYYEFVKRPGIIAFHDILDKCGVDRFWAEIKPKYRSMELVEDYNQNCAGIGVVFLDDEGSVKDDEGIAAGS